MCLGRRMKCHEVVSLSLLQTLGERAGSLENIFKEGRERSRKNSPESRYAWNPMLLGELEGNSNSFRWTGPARSQCPRKGEAGAEKWALPLALTHPYVDPVLYPWPEWSFPSFSTLSSSSSHLFMRFTAPIPFSFSSLSHFFPTNHSQVTCENMSIFYIFCYA